MTVSKETILEAALGIAQQEGWDKVSVRKIAKRIGFSTMKIYSDFGSKEDLFFELQKQGYGLLQTVYYKAIDPIEDPALKLEAIFKAHVQFALQFPAYYELLFDLKFKKYETQRIENKEKACAAIVKVVDELGTHDTQTTFIHLFALLEGFVKISRDLPDPSPEFMQSTIRQLAKNFITGIH